MGSILRTILPVAGTIFGGPGGGALGGLLGGLFGGDKSQGQASGAYGEAQGQAGLPGQLQAQYLPQLYHILSMMSPGADGQPYGVNTQQNAQTNPLVFGPLASRSMTPAFNSAVSQYGDNIGDATTGASNALAHTLGGRGFGGATSFLPSEEGAIQRGGMQQVSQQKANIGGQAANALQNQANYQQSTEYNQAKTAGDTNFNRVLQFLTSMQPANVGGLQQGGNYYQGMANNSNQGFLNGLGSLSGLLGNGKGAGNWGWLGKVFGGGHGGSGGATPVTGGGYTNPDGTFNWQGIQ